MSNPTKVLTDREREVAMLVMQGYANKEIATRLHISIETVKEHVHHILMKFGVTSRQMLLISLLDVKPAAIAKALRDRNASIFQQETKDREKQELRRAEELCAAAVE